MKPRQGLLETTFLKTENDIKDIKGKTPLHYLAESGEAIWGDMLGYAVITLLTFGARFDDSPLCLLLKECCCDIDFETIIETRKNYNIIDADSVNIR